jgi:hypothetical protein
METAIPAIIIIGLLVLATLTLTEQSLSSQDAVSKSWREMQERLEERASTDLSPVEAQTINAGATVELTLRNDGDTKLTDFDRWDVILQYGSGSGNAEWYPYGSGSNEWDVQGIYLDASKSTPEAFDPDILNPGEEMVIWVWVSPPVGTHWATVATPNGITASTVFTR